VQHRGVGSGHLLIAGEGIRVDAGGQTAPLLSGRRDRSDLLQPGGTGGLEMKARAMLLHQAVDDGINRELVTAGVDAELEAFGKPEGRAGVLQDDEIILKLPGEVGEVALVIHPLLNWPVNFGAMVATGTPSSASMARIRSEFGGCLR